MTSRRKQKVRDLISETPTYEQHDALRAAFFEGAPIVVAILGQSLLEFQIDKLLRARFKRHDDETWKILTQDHGPLYSFSQKIISAYALGIYNKRTLSYMKVVKDIRNAFAHSKRLVDFNEPSIANTLTNLEVPSTTGGKKLKAMKEIIECEDKRQAFILLCGELYVELIHYSIRSMKTSSNNYKRRSEAALRHNPFLGPLLHQQLGYRDIRGGSFGAHRSGDPTAQAQGLGQIASLFLRPIEKRDTEGK